KHVLAMDAEAGEDTAKYIYAIRGERYHTDTPSSSSSSDTPRKKKRLRLERPKVAINLYNNQSNVYHNIYYEGYKEWLVELKKKIANAANEPVVVVANSKREAKVYLAMAETQAKESPLNIKYYDADSSDKDRK